MFLLAASCACAQAPSGSAPTGVTMKQLMVDLVYPAANDILLFISRGEPRNESEWAGVRRGAATLAEAGNLLAMRAGTRKGDWTKDAKLLADTGTALYRAALAKDAKALMAMADALDASCTTCHKQYRPDIFPAEGGSK